MCVCVCVCACRVWSRHWGLSNETSYGVAQMCEAAKRLGVPPPISIQNDFAPVYRCVWACVAWVRVARSLLRHVCGMGVCGALSPKACAALT